MNNGKYDESIEKYEIAKEKAKNEGLTDKYVYCEVRIVVSLWKMYALEEALSRAQEILEYAEHEFGIDDKNVAEIHQQIGTIKILNGDFGGAIASYEKCISIGNKLGKDGLSILSAVYANMGYIHSQTGAVEKQLETSKKALEVDTKVYGKNHLYVVEDLNNLASLYIYMNRYRYAKSYLEEALDVLNQLELRGASYVSVLSNLGRIYSNTQQHEKGIDFQKEALKANMEIYGARHVDHSSIYEAIGTSFSDVGMYDSSIYYFQKGLEYSTELITSKNNSILFLLREYALSHSALGDWEESILSIEKAINLAENFSISDDNNHLIALLNDLAAIQIQRGSLDVAEETLNKTFEIIQRDPSNDTHIFLVYETLLDLQIRKGNFGEALEASRMSVKYNQRYVKDLGVSYPDLKEVLNIESFLYVLSRKAEVLELQLKDSVRIEANLDLCIKTYDILYQAIRDQSTYKERFKDKLSFLDFVHFISEGAIRVNLLAFNRSKDLIYLVNCLKFSELNKSSVLKEALANIELTNWSGIPEAIIKRESELREQISSYNTQYSSEIREKTPDSTRISLLETKLFQSKNALDSIIQLLKNEYPEEYKTVYHDISIDLNSIQSKIGSGEASLEFFLGDLVTYGLFVSNENLIVKELGSTGAIRDLINDFSDYVESTQDESSREVINNFALKSNLIYNFLLAPFSDELEEVDKMTLVLDGELNYLPFNILVTKAGAGWNSFEELPYLFKSHAIHSSHSIVKMEVKRRDSYDETFIGFAPKYYKDTLIENQSVSEIRATLSPLKWNQIEVSALAELTGGVSLTGVNASESVFKAKAGNYKIVHLAMHALVDDSDSQMSRFVFSQVDHGDTLEDGLLHTFELFNMKLGSDLAVLSSCETGLGTLVKGEGVISLAKGFAYSGVPRLVMTQWKVDDQSTSVLMSDFYTFLSEGSTVSEALRKAQQDYLNNASPNKTHPYYWGAFVVLGPDDSLFKPNYHWVIIIILVPVLAGIGIIIRYRKRPIDK
ncbi:CHAT domain-containing tetratricopeptide repeat protein [Ekhidna sp.]|uniref:CHAT domain-containing protein n=1 Tax=Ekhidna sp. TaxID=2608089 RepID=UPI00329735EC